MKVNRNVLTAKTKSMSVRSREKIRVKQEFPAPVELFFSDILNVPILAFRHAISKLLNWYMCCYRSSTLSLHAVSCQVVYPGRATNLLKELFTLYAIHSDFNLTPGFGSSCESKAHNILCGTRFYLDYLFLT